MTDARAQERHSGGCDGGDWRDLRLTSWWTGYSGRRRLPAHLTEQAGPARMSPDRHWHNNLGSEGVVNDDDDVDYWYSIQ
jgi:hypothetical protein